MGFSRKIIEECMVKSARHCCVCHRYKGVKLEVHHIKPKEQGGQDTIDNAITLCFDCHADAGHYHAKHPRGSKFSPSELKKHRANWYKQVSQGKIPQIEKKDNWHVRHLVCKNWGTIKELIEGKLIDFPLNAKPLISRNHISLFIEKIINNYEYGYRSSGYYGNSFKSKEEILDNYPETITTKEIYDERMEQMSYSLERPLRETDVTSIDHVSEQMIKEGVSPDKLGDLSYDICYCGSGDGYMEIIKLREVDLLLLAIENISDKPLKINKISGIIDNTDSYLPIIFNNAVNQPEQSYNFSNMFIKPGEMILIPQALFIEPKNGYNPESIFHSSIEHTEYGVSLEHVLETKDWKQNMEVFGPINLVHSFTYRDSSENEEEFSIHEFDFSSLFLIDKHFYCGSCPHIFIKEDRDKEWLYFTEAISGNSSNDEYSYLLKNKVCQIRIWELEEEESYFEYLNLVDANNNIFNEFKNIKLIKDEFIDIKINDTIKFPIKIEAKGYYTTTKATSVGAEAYLYRKKLITQAVSKLRQNLLA